MSVQLLFIRGMTSEARMRRAFHDSQGITWNVSSYKVIIRF